MKKALLALSLGLVAAVSAQAAEPQYYTTLSATQSHVGISNEAHDLERFDQNATSAAIAAGVTFNKNVGVELAYYDLGSRQFTNTFGESAALRTDAFGVNAVLSLPVKQDVSVFVKPGLFETVASDDFGRQRKLRPAIGAGVDYRINRHVALEGAVTSIGNFAGTDLTATFATAGVKYTF